jgi:hypothetical protein
LLNLISEAVNQSLIKYLKPQATLAVQKNWH